jgi:DNA (cytosine-5)-methyltransferase 1
MRLDGESDNFVATGLRGFFGDAPTHTLRGQGFDASEDGTGRGTPLIAFDARQSDVLTYGNRTGPLDTDEHSVAMAGRSGVRRLLPVECERLQGFPDDYTLVTYKGKPAADGPRYEAIGNSMAVPVMRWIGRRIAMVEAASEAA